MIARDIEGEQSSVSRAVLSHLPEDAEIQQIGYIEKLESDQHSVLKLPLPFQRYAVVENARAGERRAAPDCPILFLTIPTTDHRDEALQSLAKNWADAAELESTVPLKVLTLQGAKIFWNARRVAILAPAGRLQTVRLAVIEACWYEAELSEVERLLGEAWPGMESDMPLSFKFDEKTIKQRPELKQRHENVSLIRSRFARLASQVYCPHLHPPTLASQVGERFRERSRMVHRHEILGEQLAVFEGVYEACAQRASDFVQSRTGHVLEWIIILLLLAQIIMSGFDYLASSIPEEVTPISVESNVEANDVPGADLKAEGSE